MIPIETKGNLAKSKRNLAPALTDDSEEKQIIALARQRSLERLQNGTASAQEIVHFLKMGAAKSQLEKDTAKLKELQILTTVYSIDGVKQKVIVNNVINTCATTA